MTDTQAQFAYDKLQNVWSYLNWTKTRGDVDAREARNIVGDIKRDFFATYDVEMSLEPTVYELMYKHFNRTFDSFVG